MLYILHSLSLKNQVSFIDWDYQCGKIFRKWLGGIDCGRPPCIRKTAKWIRYFKFQNFTTLCVATENIETFWNGQKKLLLRIAFNRVDPNQIQQGVRTAYLFLRWMWLYAPSYSPIIFDPLLPPAPLCNGLCTNQKWAQILWYVHNMYYVWIWLSNACAKLKWYKIVNAKVISLHFELLRLTLMII